MSFALLFSGQGTQHPAMLPWLADDAWTQAVCEQLQVAHWRDRLADAPWAESNAVAQPLLAGLAMAAWMQLSPQLPAPSAVAGYSVGELPAFGAAGVLDACDIVALAARRAAAMDRCAQQMPGGGLLAVSGLPPARMAALLETTGLAVAIRNGTENLILGGPHAALEQAQALAARQGAHATRLRVQVASHTPWMRQAAQAFAQDLGQAAVHAPAVALFSNTARRVRDAAGARTALSEQIAGTVHWDDCMDSIAARQVRCVLEIGPGQALARLWNQRHPDIPARSCDDFRSAAAIAGWIGRHCGD
ncbi:acyltransferase domain-containing protein [Delftia acidovorans]|uniref:Acyltransferase domain-containing protein n=1 Tax=Delftia acidovorans TaxID=80866 RepID=A0A7T2W3C1_DELAC|nr:acyltransferase domain-containing protein [Delftia acidovorans]QPS11075.1 acyltransferase domain-containing protein [Delftia acidovorans]